MASSGLSIFNTIVIVVILIFIFFLLVSANRNREFFFGTIYRIQQGVTSGSSDTFRPSTSDLYIGRSSSPLTLTIPSNATNIIGRTIAIKNDTTNTITLVGGAGVTIMPTPGKTLQVKTGEFASLLVDPTPNNFIRLE